MKRNAVKRVIAAGLSAMLMATMLTGCTFEFASDPDDPNEEVSEQPIDTSVDTFSYDPGLSGTRITLLNSKAEIQTALEKMGAEFEEKAAASGISDKEAGGGSIMVGGNKRKAANILAMAGLIIIFIAYMFPFLMVMINSLKQKTNIDKDGRRIMIAWMRMPKAVKEENGCEWNGIMCQPRVVELENGHIYFRVHPEVRAYFDRQIPLLEKHNFSNPFCLRFPMAEGKSINIGGYRIWMENKNVTADRSEVFDGITGYPLIGRSPEISGKCNLEVFVDGNLIEIFINSGEFVISHIVYGIGRFLEAEGFEEGEISCYCHDLNR